MAFAAGVTVPLRHVHEVAPAEGGRLLLMPAWREGGDIAVKIVTVFPHNNERGVGTVAATMLLLDGATGHPKALLDGEAITLRRTGAASALASSYLSRLDSRTLLIVGTGRLASFMAHAHCAVRPIERVLVWGRRVEAARLVAAQLMAEGLPASAEAELSTALGQADIVNCATTSTAPIVLARDVRPGTHLDLVGGFTPAMREVDDELVARARVYVDTYAGALKEAGDLTQPIARGVIAREQVNAELAELVRGTRLGRTDDTQITLFKSVGTALEDYAAASFAVQRLRVG